MKKKPFFILALVGIGLTLLTAIGMTLEAVSPRLLPEMPNWLCALTIFICFCLPMLLCSILMCKVPTYTYIYKKETWSSNTTNGMGIIMISSTIIMTLIMVSFVFILPSFKHEPGARIIYAGSAFNLLFVIIIEALMLRNWIAEFYDELFPK